MSTCVRTSTANFNARQVAERGVPQRGSAALGLEAPMAAAAEAALAPRPLQVTAGDLAARGIAPIKVEYLLPPQLVARQEVAAVGSSVAPSAAAPVAPKSRNQQRKERKANLKAGLCKAFAAGSCRYGDGCRFSHDRDSFLATKQPDLAGTCPFACLPACPYGEACRWAGTHTPDPTTQHQQQQQQQEGQPPGQLEGTQAAATPAPASTGSTAAPTAAAGSDAGGEAALLAPGSCLATFPRPTAIAAPLNSFPKDLQVPLRKGTYPFDAADKVLVSLGLPPGTHRGRKQQAQGRRKDQDPKGSNTGAPTAAAAAAAAGGAGSSDTAAAAAAVAGGDSTVAGGSTAAAAAADGQQQQGAGPQQADADGVQQDRQQEEEGHEPAAKRVKRGEGVAGAGEGDMGVMAEPGEGAPVTQSPVEAARPSGDAAAAAPAGAAASTAAAAGGDGGVGPDAALLSKLAGRQEYEEGTAPARERRRRLDLAGKTYLAPLTTVGNLPFRRLAKGLGADITCGEMALATNLLQGQASEWALLKRHPSEDCFGVQVCGGYPDSMARLAQLLEEHVALDFVDLNCGCPIDIICNRGAGGALMRNEKRLQEVVRATSSILSAPLTVKLRKGYFDTGEPLAHKLIPQVAAAGAAAITLHGRTRQQRYSRLADWEYIQRCAGVAAGAGVPLIGNGDAFSYQDWAAHIEEAGVATVMVARGALVKPWVFTEIKERRLWDISAGERLDIYQRFVSHGLEHWGSDDRGVETTRRFLLEWLSYTHRYVPVGLLEVLPQQLHWRPPAYTGRNQLETLLGSDNPADWVRISEMLLGPAPPGFVFSPKHKTNAYALTAEQVAATLGGAAGSSGVLDSGVDDDAEPVEG